MLGGLLRASSAPSRPIVIWGTLSDCEDGWSRLRSFASRRFFGLRGFASLPYCWHELYLNLVAKRRKPQKQGHLFEPAFRGRAPAAICNSQERSHGPYASHDKQNTETRDLGLMTYDDSRPVSDTGTDRLTSCEVRDENQLETRSMPSTSLDNPKFITRPVFSFLSRRYVRHCAA